MRDVGKDAPAQDRPQLILDAGGVIVTNLTPAYWHELAAAAAMTYEAIRASYRTQIRERLWTGELQEPEFWQWLAASCPNVETEHARMLLYRHLTPLPAYRWLQHWSARADIHLLSNHRAEWLMPVLEDVKPCFRSMTISSQAGMSKPNSALFELADTQVKHARRKLFVDDVAGNVEAAARLGWQTLLADDEGRWIEQVNAWLG